MLVFNKWDLMDEFDRQRMERLWKTEFNRVTWAQRVNLSAKTGWHTNRLANAMRGALASWDKRIPTGKLNAFLGLIQLPTHLWTQENLTPAKTKEWD